MTPLPWRWCIDRRASSRKAQVGTHRGAVQVNPPRPTTNARFILLQHEAALKKRTAARRQDDTGGPFAPRGRCSLHDEATPIGTPTGSRYRQMRMPAQARRPTPGRRSGCCRAPRRFSVNPVTAPLSPRGLRRYVPPSPKMTDPLSVACQSSTRLTRPAVATQLLAAAPWVRSGAPCCPCGGRQQRGGPNL